MSKENENVSVCEIEGEYIDNSRMVMRQHIGTIDDHEELESISVVMNMCPMIVFKDGTIISFDWSALAHSATLIKEAVENNE